MNGIEIGGYVGDNLVWIIPVLTGIILPIAGKIAAKTDNEMDDSIVSGLMKIFTFGKFKRKK